MAVAGQGVSFIRKAYCLTVLMAAFLCVSFSHVSCAMPSEDKLSVAASQQIQRLLNKTVDAFYQSREGKPYWVRGNRLNNAGRDLFEVLNQSWTQGLNPQNYNMGEIMQMVGTKGRNRVPGTKEDAFYLELLLMDGYINYVQDMTGMRVRAYDVGLSSSDWRQPANKVQALSFLSGAGDVERFMDGLEPKGQTYQKLKGELIRLVHEANEKGEVAMTPIRMSGVLRPGRGHRAVPLIRARLGLEPVEQTHSYTYDKSLVSAVRVFQTERGLRPDGVIGPKTLSVLNRGLRDKINQVIVNMERLRWVEDRKPPRFVVVNIPSATLWALEDGKVQFEMPVIVGRRKRETPVFRTNIIGVRFNPTWTVPKTIKEKDFLPKLKQNASYLTSKGMELYQGYGAGSQTLDPTAVNWEEISQDELRALRFVQTPGKHNPLGLIRVLMPNKYDIYLHDTNHPSLFNSSNRAQSSGCVRMRYPEKMAHFILKGREGWSNDKMLSLLKRGRTADLTNKYKIPVFFLYYTTWIGDAGEVVYGEDIYKRDVRLLRALQKIDGIMIPSYNGSVASSRTY